MTKLIQNIAFPIAFIGFLLLVSTILVIDPESMNGVAVTKYFWFYSTLLISGVIAFFLSFYFKSITYIDRTKSIMIGIMTVVIIDITRNSNTEMMNAKTLLLVVISYFFFDIFFNYHKNAAKAFHFVMIVFALLETIWGFCQLYAYMPGIQKEFNLTGSMYSPYTYAILLAVTLPIALYWTITLYRNLKDKFELQVSEQEAQRMRPEIIDEIFLFMLSMLGLIGIVSILPFTANPVAWFVAICGGLFVLYFKLKMNDFVKNFIPKKRKQKTIYALSFLLITSMLVSSFYLLQKDNVDKYLLKCKISLQVLKEHPMLGVGFGNFPKAYGEAQYSYFESGEPGERAMELAENPNRPVPDLIRFTAETGIIGFILCVGLVGTSIIRSFKDFAKHPEKLAITAALIAYTLTGCLGSTVNSLPLIMIFFMLIALGTAGIPKGKALQGFIPVVISIVLIAITITITYPQFTRYEAYKEWANGRLYYNTKIYATAVKIYTPLTDILKHPRFILEYGIALSENGRHKECIEVLNQLLQSTPDPRIHNRIGKSYQALGQYELAEQSFQKAHHMEPAMVSPSFLLANLYHKMGLREKTLTYARQVVTQTTEEESKETLDMKAKMIQLIQSLD